MGSGLHIGVGVLIGVFDEVGTGVGVMVAGGPGQIARLVRANGKPPVWVVLLLLLLPPPQLNNSAAAKKASTGANTIDLRSQIIKP
ncbi:MAG: hypothetical protein ACREQC_06485 [Candidatus Binataceae bacterium]